jgi:hypothetical protein
MMVLTLASPGVEIAAVMIVGRVASFVAYGLLKRRGVRLQERRGGGKGEEPHAPARA